MECVSWPLIFCQSGSDRAGGPSQPYSGEDGAKGEKEVVIGHDLRLRILRRAHRELGTFIKDDNVIRDCLVSCFPCDAAFHTRGTFDTNSFALIKINGVVQDTRLRCGRYVNAATITGMVDLQETRGRDPRFAHQTFPSRPLYRRDRDRKGYCDSHSKYC